MSIDNFQAIHTSLLGWYDRHQRQLPWRATSTQQPNPYHVLLSEVMLQQTTVATVIDYFNRFITRWPSLSDLATAGRDELYHQWQGLGYYSRARNLHACITTITKSHAGQIPKTPEQLIQLPGIGPYTAASIAAIAYDYPVVPVDGNVTRVLARLLAIATPLPKLKNEVFKLAGHLTPERAGDFAQSLMDLGATICKPTTPLCAQCPLNHTCQSFRENQQHIIPVKAPKIQKPTCYTYAFWCQDQNGLVCLSRRPETGLLANMVGLPTCDWVETPDLLPPINPQWIQIPGTIKHTFTHFHLKVDCFITQTTEYPITFKTKPGNFKDYPIPTLMKKAIDKCQAALAGN